TAHDRPAQGELQGLGCWEGQFSRSSADGFLPSFAFCCPAEPGFLPSGAACLPAGAGSLALALPGGGALGSAWALASSEAQPADSSVPTFSKGRSAANGVAMTPKATAAPARAISGPAW